MSETNTESSVVDSAVTVSESLSMPDLPPSSPSKSVDDETRRRKILSKLWGKGNKLSHKIRELDKSTNSSDVSIHNDIDRQQLTDNPNHLLSHSSIKDPKSSLEDSSNSITSSKPLAVVKPIVVVKSGLIVTSASERTRVNNEASSTTIPKTDQTTTTTTVNEGQSSSTTTTTTNRTSSKKKKSHKHEDSKKKKTKPKSNERDRSHHHQTNESTSKKNSSSSSSKNHRRDQDEEVSTNKSSRYHSSSSNDVTHTNQRSSRSTISKRDEPSSSKRSSLSPVDHHRHSNRKYESSTYRYHRGSSRTPSRSPSRIHHSTTNGDRLPPKHSSSPKKSDRHSTTTVKSNRQPTEPISNSKSTTSISPSDSHSSHHRPDTTRDNDPHRHKTRTSDENLTNSSKSQEISPDYHRSSTKQEKSKPIPNTDETNSTRPKLSSSRHDQRSHSRHRSRSKEDKTHRKLIEPSNSDETSIHKPKTNHEKDSTTIHESSNHDKKSSRGSSIPSTHDDYRRKPSSDYHRYDRHDSPYHRKSTYHHRHRIPSPHSYYPNSHYVHHHHHHYRSPSSRYHYHRRSRYFSSTSSSSSISPRRRRSLSRTSSSYSRSRSSYSSISRTSSSRSSSRNNHYYHHEKKFRRSPTLEKLFLKASESIESVSTQKNPNPSSSSHLILVQPSATPSDIQIPTPIKSLSETNTFYPDRFTGFSAPPPPFISQPPPPQRYLKEITTQSPTSRRSVLNEVQTVSPPIQSSTSSIVDEVTSIKTLQSNELPTNIRSTSNKLPRASRFSDVTSEPPLNTNISVDTYLNYTQISENNNCLPLSRRQQKRHNREVMECECTTSEYDRSRGIKACGHECLNRMLLIECSSNCPCGQWCTNRRFQRRSYTNHKLALFKTEMKGYGLRTTATIRKGRFLVEYVGEVIDMEELGRRNKKYKRDGNIHQYVMSLIHGTVIDSTIKGNWARYINHSCEPNCSAEKWLVNGEYRMGIFAKRDLDINEEITIDYRLETFGAVDLINEKCYCGAATCRGTMSIKNNHTNSNKRFNRRQPLDDDELIDHLRDDDTNEYIIPKTIDEIRHLIQIMSRTDSENVRTIELDLIRNGSQKQLELPRLFLECNGLHVLCSWMKDILCEDIEQQYSNEFKLHLLDFIQAILPIKDRTTVIKNGLLDLIYKKLKLPLPTIDDNNSDQEQINNLINSMLDHLDDPIIAKLFYIYSTWMSLKERYIIPKRKEPQEISNHHHRHYHHHHHSSKHSHEDNNHRFNFSARSSIVQQKPIDRSFGRRSIAVRDTPRTQEQQLSKDERRKLFEQQYEDAEKARTAAAAVVTNGESPGTQNEPPYKKQRTSDTTEPMVPSTPPETQTTSSSNTNPWMLPANAFYPHQMDQTFWLHQHLSQIPIDYIRSYMTSIGQPTTVSSSSSANDEPPLPPPPRPDNENDLSRIIHLPADWSVALCPSDASVYFYNRKTMATSWTPPSSETPAEHSVPVPPPPPPLDLSPLSSAHITEQRRPHHRQLSSSSSRSAVKLSKHPYRHSRSHRHHYLSTNNKRKRPSEVASTMTVKEEPQPQSTTEETSTIINSNEQIQQEEINDKKPSEHMEETSVPIPKSSLDENNETDVSTTVKEYSDINVNPEEQVSSNDNTLSSSSKINRDLLRKNISQHVHTTLKPYTKRTCKQGRIASTDDIKYLVKKFTLAVLDKEIEKAKNEGSPLSPILTDRVRLKTEVYVKKYMNKMGPVFQRHDATVHPPSQSTTTTTNPE